VAALILKNVPSKKTPYPGGEGKIKKSPQGPIREKT